MDDNSLLRTSKEFEELYQQNVDMVYRLCYMYLKNSADTEDAVQSVFFKFLKQGKDFNDEEHKKAWLIVTAKNYCKDMLKSWWKSRRVDIDSLPEIPYWNKEEADDVLVKLLSLPPKYKTVLYLYYYEGYSVKEISQMLSRNESTIRTQLSKGRERLKVDLGGIYHG